MRLHNSYTNKIEEFTPMEDNKVKMYVCGPTVYDRAHLGNAKTPVVFDVLYRVLRNKYGKDKVTLCHQNTNQPNNSCNQKTKNYQIKPIPKP